MNIRRGIEDISGEVLGASEALIAQCKEGKELQRLWD